MSKSRIVTIVITIFLLFLFIIRATQAEVDFGSPHDPNPDTGGPPSITDCGGCDGYVKEGDKYYPEWHEDHGGFSDASVPPTEPPAPPTTAPPGGTLPPVACNAPCTGASQCPLTCPVCALGSDGRTGICQVASTPPPNSPTTTQPPPTPTKVTVPCNTPCTNSDQCPLDCPQCAIGATGQAVCKALCDQSCNGPDQCPLNCPLCAVGTGGLSTCQPAKCQCDGLDILMGELKRGQDVTFVVYIKVDPNNPRGNDAQARTVIFRLEKKIAAAWQEITNSGVVAFVGPTLAPGGATGIRRYAATWNVRIPDNDRTATAYRVRTADGDILCGVGPGVLATPTPLTATGNAQISGGFFDRLMTFFGNFWGSETAKPTSVPVLRLQTTFSSNTTTVVAPTNANSIQLGTFSPVTPTGSPNVVKRCKEIEFRLD